MLKKFGISGLVIALFLLGTFFLQKGDRFRSKNYFISSIEGMQHTPTKSMIAARGVHWTCPKCAHKNKRPYPRYKCSLCAFPFDDL